MSFNPLSVVLSENKLIGENFTDWKHNLNIVLTSEKYKFVLLEACPPEPAANAAKAIRETYDKWIASNDMARYYMLASMSNMLQQQHQGMRTAADVMASLQAMFGETSTRGVINSKGGEANMVVASSSSSKKKKKISDKRKASLKAKKKVSKTEKKAAKGGKCFHCGKEGH
ncbi:hypothetical protein UlMin_000635 [Ulmus minor]